jgi:hypothetical protein
LSMHKLKIKGANPITRTEMHQNIPIRGSAKSKTSLHSSPQLFTD